ncbi:MAG: aminoacyl--tRNA ligase-related protein [Patescibacteria group bacterium]
MRFSKLLTKTLRHAPSDEAAVNAQLLVRGGFVHKEVAGVYSILPLGLRVIEKIVRIIAEEMDAIGGVQMRTSVLQNKEVWEKTGRWSDEVVDNWFKTTLKSGGELGLSFTNEEAYSAIVKNFVSSYKDLPVYPYDFKTIFRNEARAKSGILRGREFYWKALYSFSKNKEEHDAFYEQAKEAYRRVFERVGIGAQTYITFASGGTFSKYSHEFQALSDAGEDTIYIDAEKGIAVNREVLTDDVLADLGLERAKLTEEKAIEVGNIFSLGFKFSEPFNLTYKDAEGNDVPVYMGSYGIGITRLMGAIVEIAHDDRGIIWPESVAPYRVHLVSLGDVAGRADVLYNALIKEGIEVLYDDRVDATAGEKFADADLIGCPVRCVMSEKTIAQDAIEMKRRTSSEPELVTYEELINICRSL